MGDLNITLSPLDRYARQKLYREISALTDVMTQMNLRDSYRTFHLNTKEYTLFSVPHGTFSEIGHILCKKQTSTDTKNWNNSLYLIGSPWHKVSIQQQP